MVLNSSGDTDFSLRERASLVSDNNWLDLSEVEYKYFTFLNIPVFSTPSISLNIKKQLLSKKAYKQSYYQKLLAFYGNYLLRDFWDFYYANRQDIYWQDAFLYFFSFVRGKRGLYLLVKDKLDWRISDFISEYRERLGKMIDFSRIEENINEVRNFLDSFSYIFLK